MGNDGGSIPRRDELVRMKKKPEEVYCKCLFYQYSHSYYYCRKTRIPNDSFVGNIVHLLNNVCRSQ